MVYHGICGMVLAYRLCSDRNVVFVDVKVINEHFYGDFGKNKQNGVMPKRLIIIIEFMT